LFSLHQRPTFMQKLNEKILDSIGYTKSEDTHINVHLILLEENG